MGADASHEVHTVVGCDRQQQAETSSNTTAAASNKVKG